MTLRGIIMAAGAAAAAALAGCRDVQSVLAAHGPEAERILLLSWVLFAGAGAILIGVVAVTAVAAFAPLSWRKRLGNERLVVGAGIVFPVVALSALLAYGLFVMRAGTAAPAGEPLRIAVVGEQWWWRIVYTGPDGRRFESANELRIPTGRPVDLSLSTADVIHSFWVPNLAGKVDMIPGRTNRLRLAAERPGVSRGQCAEFCGGAHALMSFYVVAMPPNEFAAWLERVASDADAPATTSLRRGQQTFLAAGCGGCHSVRGTPANGTIGPDLTHVGGRISLAAGVLASDEPAFARWIADNQHIKPQNRMPPFRIFSEAELGALAGYLASLK
jgi:cytochrome c oxidase subunit 2